MNIKLILIVLLWFTTINVVAQTPEDALRLSWFTANGSARTNAIGGAIGSLGGDITAAFTNPAGLGIYQTNEWIVSPSIMLNNNQFNYRGSNNSNSKNAFNYGTSGVVFAKPVDIKTNNLNSTAFSIAINQLASFNNHLEYQGYNNQSSFSEQYLEELTRDKADTNAALSNYIFGSSLAFRTYLIDTFAQNGQMGYKSLVPISTGILQSYNAVTSGGYNELAVALAGNYNNQWYIGGSLIIPIISYQKNTIYSETDTSTNTHNNFKSFTYREQFKSTGSGFGVKLGIIYRPTEHMRWGLAVHSPQLIALTDQVRSWMTTNTEAYTKYGTISESSDNLNNGNPGERKYTITTPWRALVSGSYLFGNALDDSRQQRGFISGDIEYVRYTSATFYPYDNSDNSISNYINTVNQSIKTTYQNNFNMHLGGELKWDVWMFRLGGAFYGSPYASDYLSANRILATTGLGYRNRGIFVDISYVQTFIKDVNFAYRLTDKPNTYASQLGSTKQIMLSFGVKF